MGLLEPHGRHRGRDGPDALSLASAGSSGRLLGIARKARPRGPVETLERAAVGLRSGIEGDHRGMLKPNGRGRRQVTAMAIADWRAALAELGGPACRWSDRRANLLVDGIDLPRRPGALLRIGAALFEITGACDPCSRMERVAPGLQAALALDWRGGRTMRVIAGGEIAVGDAVAVERRTIWETV